MLLVMPHNWDVALHFKAGCKMAAIRLSTFFFLFVFPKQYTKMWSCPTPNYWENDTGIYFGLRFLCFTIISSKGCCVFLLLQTNLYCLFMFVDILLIFFFLKSLFPIFWIYFLISANLFWIPSAQICGELIHIIEVHGKHKLGKL